MKKRTRGKEVKGKNTKDKPKCKIYIFCEGDTEIIYLSHFQNRTYNVEIIPIDSGHTDALGIVKFAKQFIKNNILDLQLGDRGYCVFDSDPKSNPNPNIKEAFNILNGAKNKGLECIFSNPSFEVWFCMHFGEVPYGLDANKMKSRIKRLVKDKYPDYSETTDIYNYLLNKQPEALQRARLLHKRQSEVFDTVYSHDCNPYTDIFLFIEYMQKVKMQNLNSSRVITQS